MRVLLDENVPVGLAKYLEGHEVASVRRMQWRGVRNGELLQLASRRFDVMVTMDRHIQHQQNLPQFSIAVILLRAPSNNIEDLEPLVPALRVALHAAKSGAVHEVRAET